ncbi:MAG: 50S ribosomal protein L4 [Elusimicrobia bacterium]|nr:50S ribosomal protein L4 [Elusimicrobiota bacterium]MDE2312632.1 50S ribosomal protein L4 [Elusimicrobiota bacterium]
MQAPLLNAQGQEVGKIELPEKIFGCTPNAQFLHEIATIHEVNQRRWTANTKSKAEVSGSGKKPWKQKHTGRARAGSIRSPLWRHGGVIFGPRANRGARRTLPARKAKEALAQILSDRFSSGGIIFVDKIEVAEPKTKAVAQILKNLKCAGPGLVMILDSAGANLARASRNLPNLELALAADLNAYGVLRARRLVLTAGALEKLSARWN